MRLPTIQQDDREPRSRSRWRRHSTSQPIGVYYERQLRELLEQVREGFARLDADEIDLFELDELILGYQRRAEALRDLCGVSGTLHASV